MKASCFLYRSLAMTVLAFTSSQWSHAGESLNLGQVSCLLEPGREAELSSEVPGVMQELKVERGEIVKKGQVLMTLNSAVEQAALETALARLEFAERKVKRNEELHRKELISDHEQDEMLTEQRLAKLQAEEARIRLLQRKIASPMEGVVTELFKEPGEYVDETRFLKIVSLNPLHAEVVFQGELYGKITKEMPVTLFTEDYHYDEGLQQGYSGIIKTLDPVIDAASNTFGVTIEIDNSEQKLAAGVRCRVAFGGVEQ